MSDWDTSKTLLMRVKEQNNEEAFKQLCDTYRPYIYTIVKQFSLNHEDCEELTQDVLVKIWKALGSFLYEPERCKFRTNGPVSKNKCPPGIWDS